MKMLNRFIFIFTNKNINDKIGIERGEQIYGI